MGRRGDDGPGRAAGFGCLAALLISVVAAAAPEEVVDLSEEEVTVRGAWAAGGVERRVPPGVAGREPPKPTTGGVRTRAGEAAFEVGLEDDAEADDEGGASHVSKKSAPAPPGVSPASGERAAAAAGRLAPSTTTRSLPKRRSSSWILRFSSSR